MSRSVPLPSVSVVIAAHNEVASIASVVHGCREHTPGLLEVIVVDDGSRDATGDAAEAAGALLVRFPSNRGKGAALREGAALARGELLVFIDGDGQDDPAEIPLLLAALEPGVALVIGSRFIGRFERGAITGVNKLGTRFLNFTLNSLFKSRVSDVLAGFRSLRRDEFARCRLSAGRYDIEVDLLLAVLSRGGLVREVPVRRRAREHGHSHLSAVRDGVAILVKILSWRMFPS